MQSLVDLEYPTDMMPKVGAEKLKSNLSVNDFSHNFRCFLALLLIAAVLWKVKQKFDRYRRRQRLFVEMEQMASRPFGSVLVELEKLPDSHGSSSASASHHSASSVLPNTSIGMYICQNFLALTKMISFFTDFFFFIFFFQSQPQMILQQPLVSGVAQVEV